MASRVLRDVPDETLVRWGAGPPTRVFLVVVVSDSPCPHCTAVLGEVETVGAREHAFITLVLRVSALVASKAKWLAPVKRFVQARSAVPVLARVGPDAPVRTALGVMLAPDIREWMAPLPGPPPAVPALSDRVWPLAPPPLSHAAPQGHGLGFGV